MPAVCTYPELQMPRWFYGIALGVIVAALAGEAFVWYHDRPSSYDECVLSEMRGQSSATMYVVQKVCAVRFHKEDELSLSYLGKSIEIRELPDFDKDPGVVMAGSKNWDNPPWIFTITKNETSYDITRARIRYSHKPSVECTDIADEDWHDGPEVVFKDNVANVNMPGELDPQTKLHRSPWCWRYMRIFGTPRKQ